MKQRWCFRHRTDLAKVIFIEDENSARVLMQVLKAQAAEWAITKEVVLEEIAMAELPAPQAAVPPPGPAVLARNPVPPAPATVTPLRPVNKRKHQRFNVRFRVILVSGARSFRTHCADVSVGGMRLEKPAPKDLMNQHCKLYISTEKQDFSIELDCRVMEDPNRPSRIVFQDAPAPMLKKLEEWIMAASVGTRNISRVA